MGGTGWCTHPKRQVSSDVRILVRSAELACRNAWGVDFWEPASGEATDAEPEDRTTPEQIPVPPTTSYDDEVTSVVNADIQQARSGRDDRVENDIIVEQSIREPEDDDEDRFDLLAHGGRDSVSKARNRMLRRRQPGQHDDVASEEPHADERKPMDFTPNDFVEEENPSPDTAGNDSGKDAVVDEDVIVSENAPQRSPRSRRIRRTREESPDPKGETAREMEAERSDPEHPRASANPSMDDRDPFNTVPSISSDIDLTRLMRAPGTPRHEAREPASSPTAPAGNVDSYDRALKRAQSIKAAARAERESRQRAQQRPIKSLRSADREPDAEPRPASERARMTTRDRDPGAIAFASDDQVPEPAVEDLPIASPGTPSSAPNQPGGDAVRRSWWRGMFQSRIDKESRAGETTTAHTPAPYADQDAGLDDHPDWMPPTDDPDRIDQAPAWADEPDEGEDAWIIAEASEPTWIAEPDHDPARPTYRPLDLSDEQDMSRYRDRLFASSAQERPRQADGPRRARTERSEHAFEPRPTSPRRRGEDAPADPSVGARHPVEDDPPPRPAVRQRSRMDAIDPADLLDDPADAWYEPESEPDFDLRALVARPLKLLDMTIEIAPDVARECATCRSYRQSDSGERGWCTNNWAFTHRQMVNASDLACQSTIGCWWLPADGEVWLDTSEPDRAPTPRVDRLIAHLDPLKEAVGR